MNSIHETKIDPRIKTYGQLKLELIQRGLYISPDILESPDVASGVCPGMPGEEVTLALTENLIVKTFLKPKDKAPMKLKVLNDKLFLDSGDEEKDEEVGIIPLPNFLKSLMKNRTPLSENICLDGYCLNIFLRALGKGEKLNMSEDYIISIVQSAFEEGSAVFKVGKSEQTQVATLSHTASLAGTQAASEAFLTRNGFGQAHSIPAFLESLKLLHICGTLDGYRLSSMSCSGGEACIIADSAVGKKVYFPALDDKQKEPVEAALGPLVTVANPLDYHTYCWGNVEITFELAQEKLLRLYLHQ